MGITTIEWTSTTLPDGTVRKGYTFNPWRGCEHAALDAGGTHPACDHCYAETMARRFPEKLGRWGAEGTRVVAPDNIWRQPLLWNTKAEAAGVRARVFCASIADVFEDWRGPMLDNKGRQLFFDDDLQFTAEGRIGEYPYQLPAVEMGDLRHRLFALIDATPWLEWLLLTKRPENVARMWCSHVNTDGLPPSRLCRSNVRIGTSISNQQTFNELRPKLLANRSLCAGLFLSAEPLLGPIDLAFCDPSEAVESIEQDPCYGVYPDGSTNHSPPGYMICDAKRHWRNICDFRESACGIDWVIVGGESGQHARPMHPDWARSLRDQCQAAGVPFFFKQWGTWEPLAKFNGRLLLSCDGKQFTSLDDDGRATVFHRVGKHAAGRLLDGREWNEFPQEVAHA